MVGYVCQEDILCGALTVRENIQFSANLRLPQTMSLEQRMKKVEKVIKQMHLSDCADTCVGTKLERGVSGGERKRTCIAMELVLSPPILFLDEPTTGEPGSERCLTYRFVCSGLDSAIAYYVMKCLKDISQNGCEYPKSWGRSTDDRCIRSSLGTVIFSIHQPGNAIFALFDHVLILASGRPVYSGPPADVARHFDPQGFEIPEGETPADRALDIIHEAAGTPAMDQIFTAYRRSAMYISSRTIPMGGSAEPDLSMLPRPSRLFAPDFFYVAQRTLRNAARNPGVLIWQGVVAIILSVLTGLLFPKLPVTIGAGVENRLKAIFFIVVIQVFSTSTALESFIGERPLFLHVRLTVPSQRTI